MIEELFLEFPALSAALLFLQKTCPSTVSGTWARLKAFHLLRAPGREAVTLQLSGIPLKDLRIEIAAGCGGSRIEPPESRKSGFEKIPLETLFKRIQLEESRATEEGRNFLVIPENSDPFQVGQLIGQLSDLEGFGVRTRGIILPPGTDQRTVFELVSETREEMPAPFGLTGAPQVLKAFDEDIFIPAGLSSPLLPAYRFLFPPTNGESLHCWFLGTGSTAEYLSIQLSKEPPVPLARGVIIPESTVKADRKTGVSKNIQIPLHLRKCHSRRALRRASQVIYLIETRGGELGSPLLRLLDLAEASIDRIRYFTDVLGEGPNAVVRHFLQMETKLADDDLWPDLKRFDLPTSLDEAGLPIFIPGECDFFPNLDGLLAGLDSQDPFLSHLREVAGLTRGGPGAVSIVDLDSQGHWIITLLENGQPLESTISVILERFHREPVRRILDAKRVDLTEEYARYERQWIDSGTEETTELGKLTAELVSRLGETAASLEGELKQLSETIAVVREASQESLSLVSAAPTRFTEFAQGAARLISSVADPRREWLMGVESRQIELARLATDLETMQTNIGNRLDEISRSFSERRSGLAESGKRLEASRKALSAAEEELIPLSRELEAATSAAIQAIAGREQSLTERMARIDKREREIIEQSQTLDERQRSVERRDAEIQRQRIEQEKRGELLERRLKEAEAQERRFQDEEKKLRRIEESELPALQKSGQELERKLEILREKNPEGRLREIKERIGAIKEEVNELSALQKELSQNQDRLSSLKGKKRKLQEATGTSEPDETDAGNGGEWVTGKGSQPGNRAGRSMFARFLDWFRR